MAAFEPCNQHDHRSQADAEDCALRAIDDGARARLKREIPVAKLWPVGHLYTLSELAESLPEKALLDAVFGVFPGDINAEPQLEVETDRGCFRIDIAVTSSRDERVRVAVEVDGFAYHDMTPAKAERDRQRDRALMRAGWRVMRFSAAEVLRGPKACAIEIVETVKAIGGEGRTAGDE